MRHSSRNSSIPSRHAQNAAAVVAELGGAGPGGLSDAEADCRLKQYGYNRLPRRPTRGPWRRFAEQFNNVLIYVLLGSALITYQLGDVPDTLVILGVVFINAMIGFVQEGKAEAALEAIRRMLSPSAVVLRNERRVTIPAENIARGDQVFVQSGDRVAADLRLLEVKNLRVDESALTGESVPVEKSIEAVAANAVLGERYCMVYAGTLVTYGQGLGIVVATGGETEIGRISAMLTQVESQVTPLQRQLEKFGHWLTGIILLMAGATWSVGVFVRGQPMDDMFMAVVAMVVAAIPEGLPAVVTITLAVGVQHMARRKAIVRRLPAVETLGSVTVICSDKTGTLTQNEMTVRSVVTAARQFAVSGVGYGSRGGFALRDVPGSLSSRESFRRGVHAEEPAETDGFQPPLSLGKPPRSGITKASGEGWGEGKVKKAAAIEDYPELAEIGRAAVLCNDALLRESHGQVHLEGDPTEGALLSLGHKTGADTARVRSAFPRIDAIPFEAEHCFMATLHRDSAGHGFILLKGAPEAVLQRCHQQRQDGMDQPLDPVYWQQRIEALASQGQRVIALAEKTLDAAQVSLNFADVAQGLTLLGLCGLVDPPRPEAIRAVNRCHAAGIRVAMITGDHAVTACAIAQQLNIGNGKAALTGADIEAMDDAALRRTVRDVDVFARASPEHKLRLVGALQANGQIVAMTGDGVNDAPALKKADVGVAMGMKGTEAAKEAAAIVLADDNFATIAHAVEEGRTIYDNLKKAILYILPTSFGQAGAVVAAILLDVTMPITPLQILWVNMVTAITLALTLSFEPPEAQVMRRKPRDPRVALVGGHAVWRIGFVSVLLVIGMLGLYLWEIEYQGASVAAGRTVAVNALVMGEIAYLFNSRLLHGSSLSWSGLVGNRYVLGAVVLMLELQGLFSYLPFMQRLFGTADISVDAWLRIAGFGLLLFLVVELEKLALRRSKPAARRRHG
ncbi:MAG: HAD family hydrolase [Methylococcaceae bacterium]|nr:MAG: HAD family hydrolase [Methylococcaceae bacterium]